MFTWLKQFANRKRVKWHVKGYAVCPNCNNTTWSQSFGIAFVECKCHKCKFTFIDVIREECFS